MAAVVEFLIKMKDGLSGPMEHIADSSKTADTALAHLTKTGEGVKQMADSATGATKKLTESLTNMDALKESMPESVKGGFESIKASLPESVASAFSGVGSLITNPFVIAGAGIVAAITYGLKNSKVKGDFTDLLGMRQGGQVYDDLRKLRTQLGDTVLEAGKGLLSVGVEADRITPMLAAMGDVAGGSGENFDKLVEGFTTVKKEGKLTTESLKTLTDAGFKPLTLMQNKFNMTDEQVQKRLNEGAFSFDDLAKSMETATEKGGVFNGVLANAKQTPIQQWNAMKTELEDISIVFGSKFKPAVDEAVVLITAGMNQFNKALEWTSVNMAKLMGWASDNADILEALAGAVIGGVVAYEAYNAVQVISYMWMMRETIGTSLLASAKGVLATVTGTLTGAQTLLNLAFLASPIGWVVLGIGALVGGIIYAWKHFEGFRKVIYGLWETFKVVFEGIGKLFKSIFSPIGEAIAAIREGRWADAAKAAGKLAFNLTPVGMAVQAVQAAKGVDVAGAYAKGEVKGGKSFYNDHQIKVTQGGAKEKTAEEKAKEAYKDSKLEEGGDKKADATGGASVEAGLSAVSGGGVKNITVSVNKMIEKLEIHIVGGGQELKQELERIVEETMVRAIASATTR